MRFSASILLVLLVTSSAKATVKDLGVVGATYPVVERDVVAELREKSRGNGSYLDLIEKMNPVPKNLQPLPRAKRDRTFLVDMSYTVEKDMKNKQGKTIYPRGYTFNPLDRLHLPVGLVVIDGTDKEQVEWLKTSPYSQNSAMKILLSGGDAMVIRDEFSRSVFYLTKDIATRLKLHAVPSVAIQEGNKMKIYEFSIED